LVPVTRLPSGYRRWTPDQIDEIKRKMAGASDADPKAKSAA